MLLLASWLPLLLGVKIIMRRTMIIKTIMINMIIILAMIMRKRKKEQVGISHSDQDHQNYHSDDDEDEWHNDCAAMQIKALIAFIRNILGSPNLGDTAS